MRKRHWSLTNLPQCYLRSKHAVLCHCQLYRVQASQCLSISRMQCNLRDVNRTLINGKRQVVIVVMVV
jgi:hypothetical protein